MTTITETQLRFSRFMFWALSMLAAGLIVNHFKPYKVRYIPIVFMFLIGPMVLMPWRRRRV